MTFFETTLNGGRGSFEKIFFQRSKIKTRLDKKMRKHVEFKKRTVTFTQKVTDIIFHKMKLCDF